MSTIRYYRDLKTWQKSMDLAVESYHLTRRLPKSETFGLVSQIRRAAGSVPANIAEGNGRMSRGPYLNHLSIAHGSLMELETHVQLASRLVFIAEPECDRFLDHCGEVSAMLLALHRSLRASDKLR